VSAGKSRRSDIKEVGRGGVQEYFDEQVELAGGMSEVFDCYKRKRGRPDRVVTWPAYSFARIHFVELKTIGGDYEAGQERDHERRRKMGAHVEVLWTKAQVDTYVAKYGRQCKP